MSEKRVISWRTFREWCRAVRTTSSPSGLIQCDAQEPVLQVKQECREDRCPIWNRLKQDKGDEG